MIRQYKVLLLMCVLVVFRVYACCYTSGIKCSSDMLAKEKSSVLPPFVNSFFSTIRSKSVETARIYLPSPHSELLLGMTVGVDELSKVPRFKQSLKDTGTIHVVVVSGFNISLVLGIVFGVVGSPYRWRNLIVANFVTLFYALLCGFEPPIIRAWIMGSIASLGKYYGRVIDCEKLLIFSGLVMSLINPLYLYSLSFQLSFLATLGLVEYGNFFSNLIYKIIPAKFALMDDLCSTLSAQVLVWPLISFSFGNVSVISPLVNTLVLWTVPVATILGMVFLVIGGICPLLGRALALVVYAPLDIFVCTTRFFSSTPLAFLSLKAGGFFLVFYYFAVLLFTVLLKSKAIGDYESN